MKKILLISLFNLLFYQTNSFCQDQTESGSSFCSQKKINSVNQLHPDDITADIPHSFDALNYELNLNVYNCFISPYQRNFSGYEILTFQADSVISNISLNAVNSSLTIDSVGLSGAAFVHSNDILTITLNRTYNIGETAEVKDLLQT